MNLFINIEIIQESTTQQLKAVVSETKHSQSQTYPNTTTNLNNERQPDKQVLNQVYKQNRYVNEQYGNSKSQYNNNMTIIVNNIAGFSPNTDKMQDIMQWIEAKKCDIFLGQEANISFKHQAMSYIMDTQWTPKYHLTTAELHWKSNTLKKPGGTFIITNEQYRCRISQVIKDEAGRWAGNVYAFKNKTTLELISMYKVENKATKCSLSNYSQQNAWLQQNNRNMDPVSAHKQDLIEAVTLWKQQYTYVIIAGDFNEYSYSEGLLFDMQTQAGLDPATTNLPQSTYLRGNQCLDHVMVTPNSFRLIQDITFLDFPKEYYTDHKPIIITINQQSISRTILPNRNTLGRKLFSQDRKNSKRYLKLRYKLYQKYKNTRENNCFS
jgi:hypothetical protein